MIYTVVEYCVTIILYYYILCALIYDLFELFIGIALMYFVI